MTDKDEKQFLVLMCALYEIYDKEGSATKTEIYFNVLKEYPIEKVKAGMNKILKNRVYSSFPKPADIIEAIEGYKEDLRSIALEQFIVAKSAMGTEGPYRNVKFDDPIIHTTIAAISTWPDFCVVETSKIHWLEEEFIDKYCMFYKQFKQGYLTEMPPGLLGMHANSPSNTTRSGLPIFQLVNTKHPTNMPKQIDEPKKNINVLKELGKKIKEKKGDV